MPQATHTSHARESPVKSDSAIPGRALSGLSIASIDKKARAGEFESFKPFPKAGRLGVVESFLAMLERHRAQGPRFGELKDVPPAPGKKPRGRPRKEIEQ
jgi:hypothetical protein